MREGLVVLNGDLTIAHLNPAAARIFRVDAASLQGLPLWATEAGMDRQPLERACQQAQRLGNSVELESFFPPDRSWLDIRIVPQGSHLLVYLLQRTFRRSADQIVAEHLERLELISQATTDIIWDWNLLDNRLWHSEDAAQFIGPSQTIDRNDKTGAWNAAVLEADRDRVHEELQTLLEGTETLGVIEYPLKRIDGKVVHLVERILLVRNQRGQAVRAIGCIRDVSEQKQLETQLRRAQRLESIGRVAGGIAHDLNNILTPVSMALDLLALDVNDSQERRVMESLQQSIAHGASLLQILLTFGSGADAEKTLLDPGQLTTDVLQIARETFPGGIRLSSTNPGGLPAIRGNSTQLRQVLLNLIMNARDAMQGRGHLQIQVQTQTLEGATAEMVGVRSGRYAVFSVTDDGPGIAPDLLDKIWDPFFTTKKEGEGTGLGLSTASAIIHAHGGGIQVASRSGMGTTFQVFIPACKGQALPGATVSPTPVSKGRRSDCTILFADDDPSIRKVAGRILEKRGFKVALAAVGADVLDRFQTENPAIDLLIIDLKLPLKDGASMVAALRKRFPTLPIIATSAYRDENNLPPALQNDLNDFVLKPFTGHELLTVVEKHLPLVNRE